MLTTTFETNRWQRLLWLDCLAGGLVGTVTLLIADHLSTWYQLPHNIIVLMGLANLAYASFSFSLALRSRRPRLLIHLLIMANLLWPVVCLRWLVIHYDTASFLGFAHLIAEALFVAVLGFTEWRWRNHLYGSLSTKKQTRTEN